MGEDHLGEEHSQLLSLLVEAIDEETSLLNLFDGFSDGYRLTRTREQRAHDTVFDSRRPLCSGRGGVLESNIEDEIL